MTRDQDRVIKLVASSPELATILNRLCLQGMDPLSYLDTCPTLIIRALLALGAESSENMDEAIANVRLAHVRGPTTQILPENSLSESLWLFLASFSEEERGESVSDVVSPLTQVQRSLQQIVGFSLFFENMVELPNDVLVRRAVEDRVRVQREAAMAITPVFELKFISTSVYIPVFTKDLGFFKGYRSGHHVVCVMNRESDSPMYFATDGTIEIDSPDLGIPIDVKITPYFGFITSERKPL